MNKKESVLFKACMAGDIKSVSKLLKGSLFSKKVNANFVDEKGYTPLMCAAQFGHKDILLLLIANGADINAVNRSGFTAVQIAEMVCKDEIVSMLLAHNAQGLKDIVNDDFRKISFNSRIELMKVLAVLKQEQPKDIFSALAGIGFKFQSDISGFFKNGTLKEKGQFLLGECGLLGIARNENNVITECEYIERGKMDFRSISLIQRIDENGNALYKSVTRSAT